MRHILSIDTVMFLVCMNFTAFALNTVNVHSILSTDNFVVFCQELVELSLILIIASSRFHTSALYVKYFTHANLEYAPTNARHSRFTTLAVN